MSRGPHGFAVARAVLVAVSAGLLLVSCAGTGQTSSTSPDSGGQADAVAGFHGLDAAHEEYIAAQQEYPLPDGQEYPPARFSDADGSYEVGYGTVAATDVWNCAWAREYLALRSDSPEDAASALDEFAAIVETDVFSRFYDAVSAQPLFLEAIEKARLGDPSGIQMIVSGSCVE